MSTIKYSIRIALLLVPILLIQSAANTAEAGHRHRHGHHFHRHHRFHIGWSNFARFGYVGVARPWVWYPRWHYQPVWAQPYYAPLNCFRGSGYGWGGYGWRGYGWGGWRGYGWGNIGWFASDNGPAAVPQPAVPSADEMIAAQSTSIAKKIILNVEVPPDARVFINESETESEGTQRSYVVSGAKSTARYDFVVRAELQRDGELTTATKTVRLSGGQTSSLSFDLNQPKSPAAPPRLVDTMISLRVPEGANVFLSGTKTQQTGAQRVFSTQRLRAGDAWEDYSIRVTWMEGGRLQAREKRITLQGGKTHEFEFGNGPTMIAAR